MNPALRPLLIACLLLPLSGCKLLIVGNSDEGGDAPREESAAPRSSSDQGGGGASAKKTNSYQPNESGAPVHELGSTYAPLTRIVGKRAFLFQSRTSISTIGDACYTPDLAFWLKKHPVGTPLFDATMRHEQIHAKRQQAMGVDPWVDRYLKDKAFMWAEEQLGWYEQIQALRRRGIRLKNDAIARNLSKYSNLMGKMVSYDEALKWVNDVMQGRWQPPR